MQRKTALATLTTLKGKPLQDQIETIESVLKESINLGEKVAKLVLNEFKSPVFEIKVRDMTKLATIALLAIVDADITTIPAQPARMPYQHKFEKLCEHFKVDLRDVLLVSRCVSQIEKML